VFRVKEQESESKVKSREETFYGAVRRKKWNNTIYIKYRGRGGDYRSVIHYCVREIGREGIGWLFLISSRCHLRGKY